jgi:hypothetical protein
MDMLKLAALDTEDLKVIAAHAQDAVGKVGDIVWRPKERRLTIELNRFVWEKAGARTKERRRTLLHFARVDAVKSAHIRRDFPDAIVSLLTIRFEGREDDPSGQVFLEFAGGGSLRLDVECIEASLTDLGAAWATEHQPSHDLA